MQAKVTLLARVNDGSKEFPYVPIHIHKRAIILPVVRESNAEKGRPEQQFGIRDIIGFYARYSENGKRHTDALGKDPIAAFLEFQRLEQDVSRVRKGLLPLQPAEPKPVAKSDRDLRGCAAEFIAELPTLGKKPNTIKAYTKAVNDFVAHCPKETIDSVDRKDILNHIAWLRDNIKRRKDGDIQTSLRKRRTYLSVFFHHFGLKCPLPMKDIAKPRRVRPWKYSIDVINLFMAGSTRDEKDFLQFFLYTGFRDREAAHCKFSAIDFEQGSINVYPNAEYGWTPKDGESREQDIVLPPKFVKVMLDRKRRMKANDNDLIFPAPKTGRRDMALLRRLQVIVKRVKFGGKASLHAIRRTFGTQVAKNHPNGIEQARIWLGHSNIETTQRYLAADEMTTKQARKAVTDMWKAVGD